jgi:hypothetical protein
MIEEEFMMQNYEASQKQQEGEQELLLQPKE